MDTLKLCLFELVKQRRQTKPTREFIPGLALLTRQVSKSPTVGRDYQSSARRANFRTPMKKLAVIVWNPSAAKVMPGITIRIVLA